MHSEKYIKIRRGSWQLLVRRGWEETDLLRLLGEKGPDGEVEAVRSSHFTRVGRLIVERDGEKVELYRKEYLARSCWEAVKSLVRTGRTRRRPA